MRSYIEPSLSIIALGLGLYLSLSSALAAEDLDWVAGIDPIYEAGPETPVVGDRWTLGSRRSDVAVVVRFDAVTDMMRGVWYGEISAPEKFLVKLNLRYENGYLESFNPKDAAARGPDAEYGYWKEGPATVDIQHMTFSLTRDDVQKMRQAETLIVKFTSYEDQSKQSYIEFPMQAFADGLTEIDSSIQSKGGSFFLKTKEELDATPLHQMPQFIIDQSMEDLQKVSAALDTPMDELFKLSNNQIQSMLDAKKEADKADQLAAVRAKHQAIYDQEPDWMDLNLCPKPDVSYCGNIGREAYTNNILLGGEFTYGDIRGVVWRSEGSIIRIYAGVVEFDIDPEIYRAETPGYYYIIQTKDDYLDLRSVEGMLIR